MVADTAPECEKAMACASGFALGLRGGLDSGAGIVLVVSFPSLAFDSKWDACPSARVAAVPGLDHETNLA